jgi:hypothetical protein
LTSISKIIQYILIRNKRSKQTNFPPNSINFYLTSRKSVGDSIIMKNLKNIQNQEVISATPLTINPENTISTFAVSKKAEIETKMKDSKFSQNNSAMIIMTMVIFALVALCAYTAYQIYQYENKINSLTSSNLVPNPSTNVNINPSITASNSTTWTGDGFSVIFEDKVPGEFSKENKEGDFEFIDNKKAKITSYIAKDVVEGDSFVNGIIGYVAGFDNKYSLEDFTKKVLDTVGPNYVLSEEKVMLFGDISASKLVSKNKRENITFYTAASSNNYYVFKTYTQGIENSELSSKAKFIQSIIPKIRLN